MSRKPSRTSKLPPLGAHVRWRLGVDDVVGIVIEHRGPLGVGGVEVLRVRRQVPGADETIESEVPMDWVTIVDPAA